MFQQNHKRKYNTHEQEQCYNQNAEQCNTRSLRKGDPSKRPTQGMLANQTNTTHRH